jgi:hypothetical protein
MFLSPGFDGMKTGLGSSEAIGVSFFEEAVSF